MANMSILYRLFYFIFVMALRNLKWILILLFAGEEKPWRVLDFEMFLTAKKAGIDPKEQSIHKQLICDGVREKKSTEIMQKFIQPDDVILELGANIGYYVLIESKILSEKGHIYAVEPGPENVKLLKKNIELNNVKNIDVFHMAMSNEKGTAKLYIGPACNLHSLIGTTGVADEQYVEVETDTVDNFLKEKRPVTFLRMDIEGYETEIIDGMRETLKSPQLKRFFVEIHPHRVSSEKMLNFLKKLLEYGFETAYCVSRDKFQRSLLGQPKVEKITIEELMKDKRVLEKQLGFELFLEKTEQTN